eukprot:4441958-Lingulodinium_polyedra.AAC.1
MECLGGCLWVLGLQAGKGLGTQGPDLPGHLEPGPGPLLPGGPMDPQPLALVAVADGEFKQFLSRHQGRGKAQSCS